MEAKTEKLGLGTSHIPYEPLLELGAVFEEGAKIYGFNNWRLGARTKGWVLERWEHADRHLHLWLEGDRSESHLAKVMWFCTVILALGEPCPHCGMYQHTDSCVTQILQTGNNNEDTDE